MNHPPDLTAICSEAETRYGRFRYFTQDDPIGRSLCEYGEWAETELALLRSFLVPGDVVLDVGANIGTHTVPFSLAVGPEGRVVAFEPQPEVFGLLEVNSQRNALANVTLHQAVAGKDAGQSAIPRLDYAAHFNFGGVAATNDFDASHVDLVQVPRHSIDSQELSRCDFLKIDAEGAELDVLKGARQTLDRHHPALYVECNAIDKGLGVMQFLRPLGYRTFYCTTAAFNSDNHRGLTDNFFGQAHESSLLFVHESDARRLAMASKLGLPAVDRKSDLVDAFVGTMRYGDEPGQPTQEYLRVLANQSGVLPGNRRFQQQVAVIVPVYNAPECLERLVASLEVAIPEPLEGLQFYFADDCSPNPEVARLFGRPFFSRPDVRWIRRTKNLGFVGNVNQSIQVLPPDTDLVLLNSDTEVFAEVFSVLQAEAYTDPLIATVTPLTNNGTIASLFRFPAGSGMPGAISPELISTALRELDLPMADRPAPTAVGFCMYMKRRAIEDVGILDETFGKGYGEEVDWCRRAINQGWKHLITCKAFVMHEGTQSFENDFKEKSLETNSEILLLRYPTYNHEVVSYIEQNPLKFERLLIVLAALKQRATQSTYLMTLHNDPDSPSGGGTEKHVRSLQRMLDEAGHAVLELFPSERGHFCLRVHRAGQVLIEERVHPSCFAHLMPILAEYVDCLHVHHVLNWPDDALTALVSAPFAHKLLSAHDYYLICPSINLLRLPGNTVFCGVEQDKEACNTCLRQWAGYENQQMASYRHKRLWLMERFDALLFPSEALRQYFEVAYRDAWPRLAPRTRITNHDLSHLMKLVPSTTPQLPRDKHIAFIGALGLHKGSMLILEAVPRLQELGFTVEIMGMLHPMPPEGLKDVRITPYQTLEELKDLLAAARPMIAAYPVVWAETFCYAYYEGMLLSEPTVPVVGPYGNPANVTREGGFGIAMPAATADALVEACVEAADRWPTLHDRKAEFVASLRRGQTSYYEAYRAAENQIVRLVPAGGRHVGRPDLQALSKADHFVPALVAAEVERGVLHAERNSEPYRAVLKIQAKLRQYPRLKSVLVLTAKVAWKTAKRLRAAVKR